MSTRNNFCSNCGEKLDTALDVKECPKCHTSLHEHSEHVQTMPSGITQQLSYKSSGTSALIAFLGGIFGLPGIGHMYVGKVGRGIGILLLGLILYALTVVFIFVFPPMALIFSIGYLILFIWQIFSARKLAKKFNELVRTSGKEPW